MTNYYRIWNSLSLSPFTSVVITKPWTIVTYMFMHSGFFHILFNMLMLYWFGRILNDYIYNRKLLVLYLLGGLGGAILYLIAYQTIPYLQESPPLLGMVGASAGVLAIIIATATLLPNYQVLLLFIGPVKLKYIAVVLVIIDIISLKGNNTGGHFAHLGGALIGFSYIWQYRKGHDIGAWMGYIFDFFEKLILFMKQPKGKRSKFKVYRTSESVKPAARQTADQEIIDRILDKIARSGYESLSDKEKDILFNASKK